VDGCVPVCHGDPADAWLGACVRVSTCNRGGVANGDDGDDEDDVMTMTMQTFMMMNMDIDDDEEEDDDDRGVHDDEHGYR
jgi:hypothetical protein